MQLLLHVVFLHLFSWRWLLVILCIRLFELIFSILVCVVLLNRLSRSALALSLPLNLVAPKADFTILARPELAVVLETRDITASRALLRVNVLLVVFSLCNCLDLLPALLGGTCQSFLLKLVLMVDV